LALLAILSKLLLHLLLELLRLALQHFLLPLLLGSLGAIALLLGQILLALGQLVELFQRVVDFLSLLLGGGRRRGLPGLVLVLFGIEFQIEQGSQIARRAASASSAATPAAGSKRNLDLPEGGLGAQQGLQSLLLIGQGVLPLFLLQLLRGRRHGCGGGHHILLKIADGLHFIGQLAGLQAAGKRNGLIAQGGL
jgi:hypothetical protein